MRDDEKITEFDLAIEEARRLRCDVADLLADGVTPEQRATLARELTGFLPDPLDGVTDAELLKARAHAPDPRAEATIERAYAIAAKWRDLPAEMDVDDALALAIEWLHGDLTPPEQRAEIREWLAAIERVLLVHEAALDEQTSRVPR